MGMRGKISSCLGTTRAAHLSLPRGNIQRCARHCSSESHRSRPKKTGMALETQGDYFNVNITKSAVDGINKTHPD